MFIVIVALKPIAAEFDVERATASLPYTAHDRIRHGRHRDGLDLRPYRRGLARLFGSAMLGVGLAVASASTSIETLILTHGLLIAFAGSSGMFSPLVADISHWFTARRGMAVALVISGAYVSPVQSGHQSHSGASTSSAGDKPTGFWPGTASS